MTRIIEVVKICACCGSESPQNIILSTNTIGTPDLDTRPPEMKRSTMPYWIEICPECGYCSNGIDTLIKGAHEIVDSEIYQKQLKYPQFPELANAFLCYSLIQENIGNFAEAGWFSIFAAWVCDDKNLESSAKICRLKAVKLLERVKENQQSFARENGAEEAILTDLLRRSGHFEEALITCEKGLKKNSEKIIARILRFQKKLISKRDTKCHKIEEVE